MIGLLLIAAAWVGIRAVQARSQLQLAQQGVHGIERQLLAGDVAGAGRALAGVRRHTAAARAQTDGPLWWLFARVPWLGAPIRTASGVSQVADELAQQVLPGLVRAGATLNPRALRVSGTHINLAPFTAARPVLQQVDARVRQLTRQLAALPAATYLPSVNRGRASALHQLEALGTRLHSAALVSELLPPMLGAHGPRRYFVGFQTNAESRGTGGMVGAFAIVEASAGRLRVVQLGSDAQLQDPPGPVINLGREFAAQFAGDGSTQLWSDSNVSPHFPYAARIWLALWAHQTGQHLDGAIGTDPVAMSYLLAATGPAPLPGGGVVSAANAVPLTEAQVYARFASRSARQAFLVSVAKAVLDRLISAPAADAAGIAQALGRAAAQRRLLVWSAHPAEEKLLAATPLGGVLPRGGGPYAEAVVINAAPSKIDYYLKRTVTYTAGACTGRQRRSTVTIQLTNAVPPGVRSAMVTPPLRGPHGQLPVGSSKLLVALYATPGAQLVGATIDGRLLLLAPAVERTHPVFTAAVDIGPGATRTIVIHLLEPTVPGRATVPVQPLVQPQLTRVAVPACP